MPDRELKISDLQQGDMVDLEGDKFADTGQNPEYEFEYQVVEKTEWEGQRCVAVYFTNGKCVGFPPDHVVKVGTQ